VKSINTQTVENSLFIAGGPGRACPGHRGDSRQSRRVTVRERFSCAACGVAIAHTHVAVAVHLILDWPQNPPFPRNVSYGWACAPCTSRPPAPAARTHLDDGFWWPHPAVDPAQPCEGCGQLVCLRTHHRRSRVVCSNACRVRTSAFQRDRKSTASINRCQQCGARVVGTRSSRRYCSSACRQRAYRIRTATRSMVSMP
jgi:hypothetical protein